MPKKSKTSPVVWLRRAVQTAFLLLFLYLFLETAFHDGNVVGKGVTLFFDFDPLVLLVTWLGTLKVPASLWLALVTVAVTLLLGRWFCGWVCPFGVLHNAFSRLRKQSVRVKLDRDAYSPHQRWKYYLLVALLVGVLVGVNVSGWLDPFSFFYRALATAVYPSANYGLQELFTWFYDKNPGVGPARVTVISEPIYNFLRGRLINPDLQPQYQWGLLIGAIFVAIVGLNFWRPRFWCRYICPLGALLGLVGKNPALRLKQNPELCNDCRLCVADCPGAANPQMTDGWKPSECFYCWNCRSACPHGALSFGFQIPRKDPDEKTSE